MLLAAASASRHRGCLDLRPRPQPQPPSTETAVAPAVVVGLYRRHHRPHSRGGGHCHRVESLAIVVGPSQPPDAPATAAADAVAVTPLSLGAVAVDPNRFIPSPLNMVDPGLRRSPRSVVEVLGTGSIPAELVAILAEHYQTIRKDGTARTPEERTGQGLHSFLSNLALGEVPVPGLERITLIGVDTEGRVHLIHSLFSVRVDVYSIECRLFACLGELPAEDLPPVTEISPDFVAVWRSVHAVPLMNHIAHLDGIFPRNCQTKPCEQAANAAGTDHHNLD